MTTKMPGPKRGPMVVRAGTGETLNVLGVTIRFLCRAEDTGQGWSLMENLIPRDAGPPAHHHPWDEAYLVTSGEVEFVVDGETTRVGAGDFVYAPADTVHAFRGVSDEPARMLIFDAPAHVEHFFKEMHAQIRDLPQDLAKIPAIGDRHGVTFLPMPA